MAGAAQAASSAAVLPAPLHDKLRKKQHPHCISFPVSAFFRSCFSRRPLLQDNYRPCATSWVFPVSEIAVDALSNATLVDIPKVDTKSEEDTPQEAISISSTRDENHVPAKEVTISAVMADVANLIKLVDTRDIIELELKHLDYELVIRKKEALSSLVASSQVAMQAVYSAYTPPPPAQPVPSAGPIPGPASAPLPAPPAQPAADLPCILSPMAGTLYKSPAPGEPAFVKVGDKVSKGQVICIVEAMKLMNEIEADQTGTVVEILAEDGKPVSVDTPLFAIRP